MRTEDSRPYRIGYLNDYEKSLRSKLKSKLSLSSREYSLEYGCGSKPSFRKRQTLLENYLDEPTEFQFKIMNDRANSTLNIWTIIKIEHHLENEKIK